MSQEIGYVKGNTKEAKLLLDQILPQLEFIILNANKEFFTIKEAMRLLSISRTQVYYLRVKGLLEYKHIGRKVYITREAIRKLINDSGAAV
jgi:hypothetical protein